MTAEHHHNEELFKGWFAAAPWNAFIFARVADIRRVEEARRTPESRLDTAATSARMHLEVQNGIVGFFQLACGLARVAELAAVRH